MLRCSRLLTGYRCVATGCCSHHCSDCSYSCRRSGRRWALANCGPGSKPAAAPAGSRRADTARTGRHMAPLHIAPVDDCGCTIDRRSCSIPNRPGKASPGPRSQFACQSSPVSLQPMGLCQWASAIRHRGRQAIACFHAEVKIGRRLPSPRPGGEGVGGEDPCNGVPRPEGNGLGVRGPAVVLPSP